MRWLAGILLLLGLLTSVRAEQPLTLDQAIERALATDPRISEMERWVEVAQALRREADAALGMKLDMNSFIGLAPAMDGGFFTEPDCGNGVSCQVRGDRYDISPGLSLWTYLEARLVKPLYTFGKVGHYRRAAEANVAVKQGDVRLRRGETIVEVKRAYYGYLTARSSRLFLASVQERVEGALELVQGWLDDGEGEATQSDLYALQSAREVVVAYVAQAEGLEKVALDGLKLLTGADLTSDLRVAGRGIRPVPLPEGDLAWWQQRALQQRPEIEQLKHGLKARRELVAGKKAMARPNLYAGVAGMISYTPGRSRIDNPFVYDIFNDYGSTPLIGLQWNWDPATTSARVERAKAELNALIEKNSFARMGIPFQVAEQYHQVHAYHESMKALEQGARAARRWMISSYSDFEAGLESSSKLVTAFQGYVLAYTEYLKAVFEYNMRVARLEQVTGAYQ